MIKTTHIFILWLQYCYISTPCLLLRWILPAACAVMGDGSGIWNLAWILDLDMYLFWMAVAWPAGGAMRTCCCAWAFVGELYTESSCNNPKSKIQAPKARRLPSLCLVFVALLLCLYVPIATKAVGPYYCKSLY